MSLCTRPYCQRAKPDHPVPALALAGFQNVQRREDTDIENLEGAEKFLVLPALSRFQQDLVDDQVVSLRGHRARRRAACPGACARPAAPP